MAMWSKPSEGYDKLNVKGFFSREDRVAAVACVIRDSNGYWIKGSAGCIGLAPPLAAELWALFYVLKLAWEINGGFGVKKFIVESDCEEALAAVVNPNPNHPFAILVDWINALLREPWDAVELTLIDRGANVVAKTLAIRSLGGPGGIVELEEVPATIQEIIDTEK